VDARTVSGETVTLVVLFRRGIAPYQSRIDTAVQALAADATVEVVWAVDDGIYDDDYTATIDAALERVPATRTLVIVGGGGVTHARVSPALQAFLDGGGAFVLNGATSESSPFVQLALAGKATILARRSNWLRPEADEPPGPETSHVDRHFVLLPTDG
jgi:hypothetical protein